MDVRPQKQMGDGRLRPRPHSITSEFYVGVIHAFPFASGLVLHNAVGERDVSANRGRGETVHDVVQRAVEAEPGGHNVAHVADLLHARQPYVCGALQLGHGRWPRSQLGGASERTRAAFYAERADPTQRQAAVLVERNVCPVPGKCYDL